MTATNLFRTSLDTLAWAWWAFVASRWSGGGPGHWSYVDAVWRRQLARGRVLATLRGMT